jgi:hypothetical protein
LRLQATDLISLVTVAAAAPLLVLGFRRYLRRRAAATNDIERLMARNGIVLGVGICAVMLMALLPVAAHLLR